MNKEEETKIVSNEQFRREQSIMHTKTGFVSARYHLVELVEGDTIDRTELKDHTKTFEEATAKYLGALAENSDAFMKDGKRPEADKVMEEMKSIQDEYEAVLRHVTELRRQNQVETRSSSSSSHVVTFKPANMLRHTAKEFFPKRNQPNNNIVESPGEENAKPDTREDDSAKPSIGQDMWKQLKRVTIPVFNGEKRTYESWKASFVACIDCAPATPEYKLLQLRQYVSGEALKAIEELGHSAAAYGIAKQRLERKFGGARRHIAVQHEQIDNFRPVRQGNAKDLERFADMLDIVVTNLQEAGRFEEMEYGSLYLKLLKKLPESMITNYQRWLYVNQRDGVVESLREWVIQEAEFETIASETINGLANTTCGPKPKRYSQNQPVATHFGNYKNKSSNDSHKGYATKCSHCNGEHGIWNCDSFKQLSSEQRWEEAKQKHLCFRCLGKSHMGQTCRRTTACGIGGCTKSHHRLLHRDIVNSNISQRADTEHGGEQTERKSIMPSNQVSAERGAQIDTTTMVASATDCDVIALRIVPVIVSNGRRELHINALLDDGSTKTYLNSDVAAELGLVGEQQCVYVNVLNGQREKLQTASVDVTLKSMDGTVNMTVNAFTTSRVTGSMKPIDWKKYQQQWKHLRGIEFPRIGTRGVIDMLIGLDYAELHCARQEVPGEVGQPIARLTPLGWTCIGIPSASKYEQSFHVVHTYFQQPDTCPCEQLDASLQRFWETEAVLSDKLPISIEDSNVLTMSKKSMSYTDGGYSVKIPWKGGKLELPNNYEMAMKRLVNTEKRLTQDPEVQEAYRTNVQQYVRKGYVTKVAVDDKNRKARWFLPHFPIVRMDKSTTKVRIVFDASAKYEGMSLNQAISQGPKLQQELTSVLTRFRRNSVAVMCDIEEMYLRVRIQPEDQPYFSFLWRDMDSEQKPQVYEFNRVVFGVNCSPFLAQLVIREHAERNRNEYPLAAETILRSTYMDDSMDSVTSDNQGIELYSQLSALLAKADMHARKWLSNSETVLSVIAKEDQVKALSIEGDPIQGIKTLGMMWLATEDVFMFQVKAIPRGFVYTKRSVLQRVAMIFDPLGFLTPFTVRAKMLLQKIWLAGTDWDEPLNEQLKQETEHWFTELENVNEVKVPRCLCIATYGSVTAMTLHVFVDASSEAYGAVIYARCTYDENVSVRIIAAKARVAPLAATSIPRLELMAAILGLRLAKASLLSLSMDMIAVTFWSDSMNVLWWIRQRSRMYQPFVANRIGEIQEITRPNQWRHVPTKLNPADLASRGASVNDIGSDSLWLNGPDFLHLPEVTWPSDPIDRMSTTATTSEIKRKYQDDPSLCSFFTELQFDTEDRLKPERYSDWQRLVRSCAWVVRFINNSSRAAPNRRKGELTCDEIRDVEYMIYKQCQQEAFAEEYVALRSGKPLPNKSKLRILNPRLDEDGLIRSDSRLVNGGLLSFDMRYPLILPRKHAVTKLIIKQHHERGAHVCGVNHLLSWISQKFWIISGREAIKAFESECKICHRKKAQAATQIMAPLPNARVTMPTSLRAFSHSAVDYAGPFETIRGRGKTREKRYLCLFTCIHTRAVHLEMAYGLDTDSFLRALQRFIDRRGCPESMLSDNGRNFVGAAHELDELYQQLYQDRITKAMAVQKIKWSFNPPAAPHFGGVFESMIKAAKRAAFAILSKADVTDEELQSAFIGAEALLNARPLTYQSADCNDITPITPGHFLHGQLGGACVLQSDVSDNPRKRWRRVQELVRHFWQRWLKEWLPSLATRKKWGTVNREFAVGDIVLVVSPDTARGHYPLGRIIKVYPGKDGHVRVVDLQTGSSILKRPITSLCPLEFAETGQ